MEFKTISLNDSELKFAPNEGAFTGYASKFGGVDDYGDTIHPGAFSRVAGVESEIKMYFNHGWQKRELPIGKMTVIQDDVGLMVKSAEFTHGIRMADEAALAVKHRTVNGLSIAYRINEDKTKNKASGGREIYEIDFLKEVSVVDWPADGHALIDVKSALQEAASLKAVEEMMEARFGLSQGESCALVARIKSLADGDRRTKADAAVIAELFQRFPG